MKIPCNNRSNFQTAGWAIVVCIIAVVCADAEERVLVPTTGGLSEDFSQRHYQPEELWCWQPVRRPEIPERLASGSDERTTSVIGSRAIDWLLQNRMPGGLLPAAAADRAVLIRRASLTLTGLPPAIEDIRQFVNDPRDDDTAFRELVERLLASEHYGERMAQHWLDVVRYADSSGFSNDYERGNAWRYRDYVVRSFNADKPFDQFVQEQIAGDEIDPADPEMLIAVGFLRMGPWELTGMEVARVARQRFLDDVTNSVGETFLAQSLQCARCHDHKFDPISTGDYYSIQAVFATTQIVERPAAFLPTENTSGFDEVQYLDARRQDYLGILSQLDEKQLDNAQQWFRQQQIDPSAWNATVERIRRQPVNADRRNSEAASVFNRARRAFLNEGVPEDRFPPKLVGFTAQDYGIERIARKGLERLLWEYDRYEPVALSVYSGPTPRLTSVVAPLRMPRDLAAGELENPCVLLGGDPFSPGPPVQPAALSVLRHELPDEFPRTPSGRRLAFARWVASEQNPLTARVIANRVWLWDFQVPLAGNPNNFGSSGSRPTHPELLDWLAATLVEQNWSLKSLHRIILNSAAWRRSTGHPNPERLDALDPDRTSYAVFRPRRLSGEELRDALLKAAGELNPAIGGIPNRPEINAEVALQPRQVMGTFAAAWVPNPLPEQRHRRSLYALKLRGLRDPFVETFNQPVPDLSCERREVSTVTPQVFALMNSQFVHQRALSLARRALQNGADDAAAIEHCFLAALGRLPAVEETEECLSVWQRHQQQFAGEWKRVDVPQQIVREAVEENTGERFSFSETLYSNSQFVADLGPQDVDLRTRALADVCLAILNSSEFIYVY